MAIRDFYNNFSTTSSASLATGGTSLTVTDASAISTPATGHELYLTLEDATDPTVVEIVKVTNVSGNVLTIVRQQESTTSPTTFPVGTIVECRVTAAMLNNLFQFDQTGDALGTGALNLQTGRAASTKVASGNYGIALGYGSEASSDFSHALGHNSVCNSGTYALAVGPFADAAGAEATAIGSQANASGQYGIAIGKQADADNNGIAIGQSSEALNTNSVALGIFSDAKGDDATALGYGASAAAAGATAVGDSAKANTANGVSIGNLPDIEIYTDYAAWAASTAYTAGNIRRFASGSTYMLYCTKSGTSAGSEPSATPGFVTDNTAEWFVFTITTSGNEIAIGNQAKPMGEHAISIGTLSDAKGYSSVALGTVNVWGHNSIGIGIGNVIGNQSILISQQADTIRRDHTIGMGAVAHVNDSRALDGAVCIAAQDAAKFTPFRHAQYLSGVEFIDHHNQLYTGTANVAETMLQHTREVTFYTVPVQLGDGTWTASTTYSHGDCVLPPTPNGYSYVAIINGANYFTTGDSNSTPPSWPTTAGNTVVDNEVTWLCVDLSSIQLLLPDYARFTPTAVGVVTRDCAQSGTVTQPSMSWGINGALTKWKAATTATLLDGNDNGVCQFWDPTNSASAKQFGGAVTTNGTNIDCTGVLAFKGFVVESLTT